jgi:hypothetical protein
MIGPLSRTLGLPALKPGAVMAVLLEIPLESI